MKNKVLVKDAIGIAWPAVLESFFISLAGMIDTMMVSNLGKEAVASVGLTLQPKFIGLTFFFAINVAVSALVARRKGEEDQREANATLITAISVVAVLSVIITILCVSFANQFIHLAGSQSDTHAGAVTYFQIIMGGMFFNVMGMVINSALRGVGDTRVAMVTNVTSSIVNVVFNYLLIEGHFGFPRLELAGAALATVLGTVVAFLMSGYFILRKNYFISIPYVIDNHIRPKLDTFKRIVRFGSNMLVEFLTMRVGFMATALLAAKLGTDTFAAHQVGMNFLSLGFAFADGMQVAAVALTGRSLGAGKPKEARTYGSICQRIGLVISFILAIIMLVFGKKLFGLFFIEEHILEMGVLITRFIVVIVLLQISQIIFGGCLRAAGDIRFTLFASILAITIIRTSVTYLCTEVFQLGLMGIWLGILSDQASRFLLLGWRFTFTDWTKKKI